MSFLLTRWSTMHHLRMHPPDPPIAVVLATFKKRRVGWEVW